METLLLSCFRNALEPVPFAHLSIEKFLSAVKNGKWQKQIEAFRNLDYKNQQAAKKKLPCITISGSFTRREEKSLSTYAGLVCVDIDINIGDNGEVPEGSRDNLALVRSFIETDKYTYACFESSSGSGLAVIVKVDSGPSEHAEAYKQITNYYNSKFGVAIKKDPASLKCYTDPSCKDLPRLRFISYDPTLFFNRISDVFSMKDGALSEGQKKTLETLGINDQLKTKIEALRIREAVERKRTDSAPLDIEDIHKEAMAYYDQDIKSRKGSLNNTKYQSVYHDDDIIRLIDYIKNSNTVLGHDKYDSWLHIAFALHTEFGESGRSHFHKLSSVSPRYDERECDTKFTHCAKTNQRKIHIGTLFFYAKEAGIDPGIFINKSNNVIVHAALCAKDSPEGQRTPESVTNLLKTIHNIPESESKNVIDKVYEREVPNPQSEMTPVQKIMNLIASKYPDLKRNDIIKRVELNGKPMDQVMFCSILVDLKGRDKTIKTASVEEIIGSDFIESFNPLKDFFSQREKNPYDETFPLIAQLSDSIISDTGTLEIGAETHVNTEIKEKWLKKWLCGIIHSIFDSHSPLTLVLTGPQNSGKTEFFRRLLPKEFTPYYAEIKLHGTKDDEIVLCENLIVMDDECTGKTLKENRNLKSITSKSYFTVRRPYDRHPQKMRRLAVLCGTTNDDTVIFDNTGNRRIIPINVISVDHKKYNSINKEDLMMEIYHLWKSDFEWQMSKEDIKELEKYTQNHVAPDSNVELIAEHFELPCEPEAVGSRHLTNTEIKDWIEKNSEQKIKNNRDLGVALKNLGFKKVTSRYGHNQPLSGYWMIRRNFSS